MMNSYLETQIRRVMSEFYTLADSMLTEHPGLAERIRFLASHLESPLEACERARMYKEEPARLLGRRQGINFLINPEPDGYTVWLHDQQLEQRWPDFVTALAVVRVNLRSSGVPEEELP